MRKHIKLLMAVVLAMTLLAGVCSLASAEESTTHTHQYQIDTSKSLAPGCLTEGYTYYYCPGCGDSYTVPIPAVGHKMTTIEEITQAPTCGSAGYKTVIVKCPHCGYEQSRTREEIPATGAHSYKTENKNATCTEPGYYRVTCSVCGAILTNETYPALGHSWAVTSETPATCTSAGSRTYTCANCSQTRSESIPQLSHQWTSAITKAATCTESGVLTYTCSLCGATKTETIPATGHNWSGYTITVAPTCVSSGTATYTCANCGATKTETIPATGAHTPGGWEYTTPASCTSTGTATQKCVVCGEVIDTKSIPATGHHFGNWMVLVPATCTSSGQEQRVCATCGKTETRTTGAMGHNWTNWEITVPATATSTGLYQRTCLNCHTTETQVIPKLGLKDTLCAFGLRLKDVGSYLNPAYSTWYMFTPFNASVDGMQTYELVVNDAYIVGTCTLTVLNGEVSFSYTLNTAAVQIQEEFFTILNKMTDLTQYEPEELMSKYAMKTNTPYSISQQFGGDTNLVLYMCCRVRFEYDDSMESLNYNSTYHQSLVNMMTQMLDK